MGSLHLKYLIHSPSSTLISLTCTFLEKLYAKTKKDMHMLFLAKLYEIKKLKLKDPKACELLIFLINNHKFFSIQAEGKALYTLAKMQNSFEKKSAYLYQLADKSQHPNPDKQSYSHNLIPAFQVALLDASGLWVRVSKPGNLLRSLSSTSTVLYIFSWMVLLNSKRDMYPSHRYYYVKCIAV